MLSSDIFAAMVAKGLVAGIGGPCGAADGVAVLHATVRGEGPGEPRQQVWPFLSFAPKTLYFVFLKRVSKPKSMIPSTRELHIKNTSKIIHGRIHPDSDHGTLQEWVTTPASLQQIGSTLTIQKITEAESQRTVGRPMAHSRPWA